jgi:hypothetical protein
MVLFLVGLAGASAGARADPPGGQQSPPKASSFAPHHSGKRVYGSPIGPQILHSRKRKPAAHQAASPASASRSHAAAPQP